MSSLSNFIVQSDLQQNSEVIESDRSSILSIETGVHEKTKETIDASSVEEEIGDTCSDVENDYSANDNGCSEPSNDLQMPLRQYSREVLLQLKESPTSNIFPSCLEESPKSILASHLTGKDQNNDKKSNESTTEDNSNDVKRKQFKKKNAVEKEEPGVGKKHLNVQDRLKKDEIVLSPQRRSFNTGCSGSSSIFNILPNRTISTRHRLDSLSSSKDLRDSDLNNEHRKQRLDSLGQNQPRDFSQLSRDSNNRRLNRGRLMSRDSAWETRDPDSSVNYGFDKRVLNNSGGGSDRRLNNDDERNRYGYFDRKKNYNNDHVRIEKEPEWFSAGPTSQYDVIELQGFEDYRKDMQGKKNKKSETNAKKTESAAKDKTKETSSSDTSKSESFKQKKTEETIMEKKDSTESQSLSKESESQLKPQKDTSTENKARNFMNNSTISPSLPDDIDAFLNFSELLVDDDDTEITKSRTSKFSLWCQQPDSSSNNVVNWISEKEPVSQSSTNSSAFGEVFSEKNVNEVKHAEEKSHGDNSNWPSFTENSHTTEKSVSDGKTLFERLLMAPPSAAASVIGNSTVGKVHSVEELEAHIRKPQISKKEEDMAAFKKLFNQSKPSVPTNLVSAAFNQVPSKPVVVQQPQPQPRVAEVPPHQPQPFGFQHANFPVAAADPAVAARLQQAQSEMLKMGMFGIHNQQVVPKPTDLAAPIGAVITPALGIFPTPAPPALVQTPFMRDSVEHTMQKAEAAMMLHALKQGEITVAELLDSNYPLPPRFREVVPGVLKYWLQHPARQDGNIPISPRAYPGLGPRLSERRVQPLLVPPPIQPEPISQLSVPMQPAFKQRIPSPQEIAIHTQGIMHNALVKKKLEEQRENYKRRQEMWRARSPATDESGGSQQLLSTFTPTSVLRQQKRKTETNPAGGDQFLKFTDQLFRANDAQQQQQIQKQQQQAKNFDMFMNKGRPIIKKSEGTQFNPIETPYPVHPGQFRSQTPALQPTTAQNFLAGFVHPHEQQQQQQQQSHFAARNATNLASATACLQGLLLDNRGGDHLTVTSQLGGFNRQSAGDEGGALSRWLTPKLIEDGLAGKLPDIPTQKMLSVEELERVQTVHN